MEPSSQFIVPTIIDVPELIVTNEDIDFDDTSGLTGGGGAGGHLSGAHSAYWAGKLQFLSSSLCYTIGLGNLWRFPYLCYKHAGGAYLVAYTLMLVAVGMPLLLMELAFGQYANESPITIWRISPAFEGIGYSMCLISSLIAIYYQLINTWVLHYLMATLTFGPLPWNSCDNSWNSEHCFYKPETNFEQRAPDQAAASNCSSEGGAANATIGPMLESLSTSSGHTSSSSSSSSSSSTTNTITTIISINNNNNNNNNSILDAPSAPNTTCPSEFQFDKILSTTNEVQLPANEFFHEHVLGLASKRALDEGALLGQWNWNLLLGLALLWAVVLCVLLKNLRPSLSSLSLALSCSDLCNKLALGALVMPFLALFALLLRALTLPGASQGVAYYATPQWQRLADIDIWADAVTQLFFSLAPCWGGIITLANQNKFHENFHANTMLIVLVNTLVSLAAGLAAFATLGFMAQYSGIKIQEVADSGVGLIFQVYPEALAQMPLSKLNSGVFFAILLALGLASQLTVIETVITTIVDTWPHKLRYRRPLVLVALCGSSLLLSLPATFGTGLYLLQSMDAFAGTLTGMLIGILELIAIAWVYGMENFMQDIDDMLSVHRPLFPSRAYWYFMWRYFTPSTLFAVLLFSLTDSAALAYRDVSPLPAWMSRIGWLSTGLCASLILFVALLRLLLSPGESLADKLSYLCRPSEDWAPSSYISGPKLINRHQMLDDSELQASQYSGRSGTSGARSNSAQGRYGHSSPSQLDEDALSQGVGGAGAEPLGVVYHSKRAHRDQDLISNESTNDDDDHDDHDESAQLKTTGTGRLAGAAARPDDANSLKLAHGNTSYIIPEDDEDDDDEDDEEANAAVRLMTSETNV